MPETNFNFIRKAKNVGGSLNVSIPKELVELLGIKEGDYVILKLIGKVDLKQGNKEERGDN